jgi:hypothetical protein
MQAGLHAAFSFIKTRLVFHAWKFKHPGGNFHGSMEQMEQGFHGTEMVEYISEIWDGLLAAKPTMDQSTIICFECRFINNSL